MRKGPDSVRFTVCVLIANPVCCWGEGGLTGLNTRLTTNVIEVLPPDVSRLFPDNDAEQRVAADVALSRALTVLTGGPGTGKTTTVARLLALLAEQADVDGRARLRIGLAAGPWRSHAAGRASAGQPS